MMSPNVKGPAAGESAAGPVVDRDHHISVSDIDLREIYAIAALAIYPEARTRLRELGAAPIALLTNETAATLTDALLDEAATVAEAMAAVASTPEAMQFLIEAQGAAEAMEGADGAEWGTQLVARLVEERAREWAPLTLAWARDALAQRWTTPARIRATVDAVLALAAGDPVEGRAA